jgi:hypothetical protein
MEYVLVFGYFHTAAFQPYIYDSIDAGGGGVERTYSDVSAFEQNKSLEF